MGKPRTMKKIWVGKSKRKHWSRRDRARPYQVRRETNEEIMHRSILERGFVRLRFQPQILHPDMGTYAGYQGAAITIDMDEIKQARELIERVHETVRQYAQERGLPARPRPAEHEHSTD